MAESFFATLENGMHCLRSRPNREEARSAAVGCIGGRCSRARPHSTIGYRTPAGKMEAFFERSAPKREEVRLVA